MVSMTKAVEPRAIRHLIRPLLLLTRGVKRGHEVVWEKADLAALAGPPPRRRGEPRASTGLPRG